MPGSHRAGQPRDGLIIRSSEHSRGGASAQANRTAIGYTLTGAQAVTLRLRLLAGLVKCGKVASIRIVETDPGGESATLLIRFRG